ncbi:hypothetical protein C8Q76DRAFT_242388 [Earliella scabrosa]|nr:hypothetical protein C8Q76DRAFT_242388 [Earliella scabrosa]
MGLCLQHPKRYPSRVHLPGTTTVRYSSEQLFVDESELAAARTHFTATRAERVNALHWQVPSMPISDCREPARSGDRRGDAYSRSAGLARCWQTATPAFHPDHRDFAVPTDGAPLPAVSRFVSGHGQHDPFLSRSSRPIHLPPRFRNDLPSATCSLETCSLPWPARIPNSRPRPCSTARTYPLYLVCGSPTLASVRNVGLPPYHRRTVSIVPFPCSFPGVTMPRHYPGSFRPRLRLVEHS